MKQDNRVLARLGARELTPQELDHVAGGAEVVHTYTVCSYDPKTHSADGDTFFGECA